MDHRYTLPTFPPSLTLVCASKLSPGIISSMKCLLTTPGWVQFLLCIPFYSSVSLLILFLNTLCLLLDSQPLKGSWNSLPIFEPQHHFLALQLGKLPKLSFFICKMGIIILVLLGVLMVKFVKHWNNAWNLSAHKYELWKNKIKLNSNYYQESLYWQCLAQSPVCSRCSVGVKRNRD